MRFLADESCDTAIVRMLRGAGHDVESVAETSPSASDRAVISRGVVDQRIIVTQDRDFGALAVGLEPTARCGVILVRYPATDRQRRAAAVLDAVQRFGESLSQMFLVVQPGRVRVGKLS